MSDRAAPAEQAAHADHAGHRDRAVIDLPTAGRRWRVVAAVVVLALLVAGTLWGDDDDFPFGPLRMYASTEPLDTTVRWYELRAASSAGGSAGGPAATVTPTELAFEEVGLRRAELEGRLAQLVEDPARLGELAASYARRHPSAPPLVLLQVVEHRQSLAGGRPQGEPTETVVVTWQQP